MFNRGALIGFGLAVAEVVTFVLAVGAVGAANVVFLSIVLTVVGLAVIRGRLTALLESAVDADSLAATDRALAVLGGLLLVVPGLLTGLAGALFLVPPVRALLGGSARRRFAQLVPRALGTPFPVDGFPTRRRHSSRSDVIDVDIVSEDMTRSAPNELR